MSACNESKLDLSQAFILMSTIIWGKQSAPAKGSSKLFRCGEAKGSSYGLYGDSARSASSPVANPGCVSHNLVGEIVPDKRIVAKKTRVR